MAWGLPKLPGLTFSDPTRSKFQLRHSLKYQNGYRMPDSKVRGTGGVPTDRESTAFGVRDDALHYDPSLTYGRVKQPALPTVLPAYVHNDKKCLTFRAFLKQSVHESQDESYRVRYVNIIYFLEDDTITVMEPAIPNCGLWQGRMVKRDRIPKNDMGEYWHWRDLNNGKDIAIFGKVFHTISCDDFTKEYLMSQGVELAAEEQPPQDPYLDKKHWRDKNPPTIATSKEDKMRRFLEYDGKVLMFNTVWDDRDSPFGELREYKLMYFLYDDTIAIKELHDGKGGRDPFPLLLKKMKVPKKWRQRPVTFPSVFLELSDAEVTEYYSPKDLIVGETVFVLGRRFLLYDCDQFTRKYYKTILGINQPDPVNVPKEKNREFQRSLPPHIIIGTPEDSIQSCFSLMPKPPKKDVIKQILNASKNLRYLCELEWIHPEDEGRKFVLSYNLGDGMIKIDEIPRKNSGRREGRFLSSRLLELPDSDHSFPTYYTPDKFYIGAVIPVNKFRFKIIGCDLFVYRYMSANPDKFPQEVIDNVRNYHLAQGTLPDELEGACAEETAADHRAKLAQIGASAVAKPNLMQECLAALDVVEGQTEPVRPPTPPATTDNISYDDTLRQIRDIKFQGEQDLSPLKGILKSGGPREGQDQKVVCFTGEAPPPCDDFPRNKEATKQKTSSERPLFYPGDICELYGDPLAQERAERRARGECHYPVVPSREVWDPRFQKVDPIKAAEAEQGFLRGQGVDCKKTPDFMRLPADAYAKVKHMRSNIPDISPEAERLKKYPLAEHPPLDTCQKEAEPTPPGICPEPETEHVAFACPRVEPREPCCDPDERNCIESTRC